jgi:hypothetical protein
MTEETVPQVPVVENSSKILVVPETIDMLRVGVLGLLVGLFIPLISWLLQRYFIEPVFCQETTALGVCAPNDMTTYYIATVVMTVIAVALLANWQIFRPLLIAVAAASALWGLQRYLGDTVAKAGWEYYLSSGISYALVSLLFYWLLRLRSFALSVGLCVVAVVLIRWVLLT